MLVVWRERILKGISEVWISICFEEPTACFDFWYRGNGTRALSRARVRVREAVTKCSTENCNTEVVCVL